MFQVFEIFYLLFLVPSYQNPVCVSYTCTASLFRLATSRVAYGYCIDRAGSGDSQRVSGLGGGILPGHLRPSVWVSCSEHCHTAPSFPFASQFGVPVFWLQVFSFAFWWSCSVTEGIVDRGRLLAAAHHLSHLVQSARLLGLVCSYHPGRPATACVEISCAFALVVIVFCSFVFPWVAYIFLFLGFFLRFRWKLQWMLRRGAKVVGSLRPCRSEPCLSFLLAWRSLGLCIEFLGWTSFFFRILPCCYLAFSVLAKSEAIQIPS